jgi:chromosome segregation ATPase
MSKVEEYAYEVTEENKKLKSQIEELKANIEKLQSENMQLQDESVRLSELAESMRSQLANAFHKIVSAENSNNAEIADLKRQVEDANKRRKKKKKELKDLKRLLYERNRRYQEDCITINRLNTTIDVLTERIAAMRSGR